MISYDRSTYKDLSDFNWPISLGREVNLLYCNHLYMIVNKLSYILIDKHTMF